jgi:hypothetical protein
MKNKCQYSDYRRKFSKTKREYCSSRMHGHTSKNFPDNSAPFHTYIFVDTVGTNAKHFIKMNFK